jgi:NADPH:quinone reductase-like Zn-dependent oxidoreductase
MTIAMRAAIFDEPGITNLKVMDNVIKPQINDHYVLVKVKTAGVNPMSLNLTDNLRFKQF